MVVIIKYVSPSTNCVGQASTAVARCLAIPHSHCCSGILPVLSVVDLLMADDVKL